MLLNMEFLFYSWSSHFNKYLFLKKNYIIFLNNFSIILLNSYDVYKFPSSRLPSDALEAKGYKEIFRSKDKNSKYLLKIPYPYDDAIDFIKQKKAEKNTLLMVPHMVFFLK